MANWTDKLPERVFESEFDIRQNKDVPDEDKIRVRVKYDASGVTPEGLASYLTKHRNITLQNTLRRGDMTAEEFAQKCADADGSTFTLLPSGSSGFAKVTPKQAISVLQKAVTNGEVDLDDLTPASRAIVEAAIKKADEEESA